MIIMQLNGLSKAYGAEDILSNIKLEVKSKDRIAIVGRNGSGKSTLLKIMAGELSHDTGEIIRPKGVNTGYLSQHTDLDSDETIWNEMMTCFHHLLKQEKELRHLEEKMGEASSLSSSEYTQLLEEYDRKQQAFERNGGYTYEADIKSVLSGLSFDSFDYDTHINTLSGGQKTRLALGKLLLKKPDLLILDEPTNHLDIDTLSWLEGYLASYPGAIVIVSHDRYFLDKTVSIVYEISRHKMKKYHGSYTKFLEQRAQDYEKELKEYEKQQVEINKMEDFIQRNLVRASTTKRAQSRRRKLEKMERIEKPLGSEGSVSFSFDINRRSGNDVLKLEDLSFQYKDDTDKLFHGLNLHINRGDRMALIGPNGVGKTTLLKVILGRLDASSGVIQKGTNVQIGYYDQEQADLNSQKTVLDELWDGYPQINEADIRTVLGNFLFSGEDVLKHVSSLSGGEKARLALAKLKMQNSNLLILDEPTNHLDIDSKEVLEAALADFPGTIIFVSHDRYFINSIADHVVEMERDEFTVYLGDYDYYIDKKKEEEEIRSLQETSEIIETVDEGRLSFEQEKRLQSERRKIERRINQLEEEIEELELEQAKLEEEMAKPEVYEDHEVALEYTKKTSDIKQKIEQLLEEWTALHDG
ncbi:ABC-F family ATP-binding cassette domain-containing protein [Virgibacillus sp. MSJ-26]|uniref:ABC-F family ATP-binding cassette domain-containing protein n=1 Tax=Virgibacillus sp. MSJ-26 TaxID=2841522 RepID=UPI001C1252F6|nr:ABC-F family ATP-binding cassette domain-containing protein [Virgibacillus sp. MSJ-26]MBU5466944.1 ABC-F family ATP-binding cassette domain-containing protein [Virgibacillus sp. MSJ-26]